MSAAVPATVTTVLDTASILVFSAETSASLTSLVFFALALVELLVLNQFVHPTVGLFIVPLGLHELCHLYLIHLVQVECLSAKRHSMRFKVRHEVPL